MPIYFSGFRIIIIIIIIITRKPYACTRLTDGRGWTDGRTDGRGWTDGRTDGDGRMDGLTGGQIHRHIDKQTDNNLILVRYIEGQTYTQMDRQTYSHYNIDTSPTKIFRYL